MEVETYDFRPLPADVAAQAFGTHPLVLDFGGRHAVAFEARRVNGSAAFGTRYQSFVLSLAVVLRRTQTLGTEQRRRMHLQIDNLVVVASVIVSILNEWAK